MIRRGGDLGAFVPNPESLKSLQTSKPSSAVLPMSHLQGQKTSLVISFDLLFVIEYSWLAAYCELEVECDVSLRKKFRLDLKACSSREMQCFPWNVVQMVHHSAENYFYLNMPGFHLQA